nr:MAG TPA: hypothetical protein [Bacteriophage sp.]
MICKLFNVKESRSLFNSERLLCLLKHFSCLCSITSTSANIKAVISL